MLIRNRGFSLVELMVVVGIFGILLSLGIPWAQNAMTNSRIHSAANEIKESIQYARMEAIKRNATIVFQSYTLPMKTEVKTTATTAEILRTSQFNTSIKNSVSYPATSITFSSNGRTNSEVKMDITSATTSQCQPLKQGDNAYTATGELVCLRVIVNPGGMIKVCNPSAAANGATSC